MVGGPPPICWNTRARIENLGTFVNDSIKGSVTLDQDVDMNIDARIATSLAMVWWYAEN